ncbi:endochitinase A isoform X2 [Cephus cinctus]|uniref:Endochitinase A isoform X2 n=1 Tax=Cephus cinctus TaxID=211228 RepID=A0AAJ7CBU3_CEPCN|nr:endochitinase A isoform X2 [Cephus cinctus]
MRYSSCELLGYAVLTLTLHLNGQANGGITCKDLQGRSFESGFHYIPGPEPCTLCVCDNGNPKWCKAVICTLPQDALPKHDCKSFRFGNTCCEFICMDDTLSSVSNDKGDGHGANISDPNANSDLGFRVIVSCVTAAISLGVVFLVIHRLRQRKIRAGRQSCQLPTEDELRSLGSMNYLERGGLPRGVPMEDMPCGGGYPLWKPPGNYFPRGEAPPPYEEAVAAARAEQALLSMSPHALSPLNFPSSYLANHNSHASIPIVPSNEGLSSTSPNLSANHGTSTSPLIASNNRPHSSPGANTNCHQLNESDNSNTTTGLYPSSSTNFNMGTNTYENLPTPVGISSIVQQHTSIQNTMLSLPTSHSTVPKTYQQHTTLPRQGGAFTISATLPSSNTSSHRTIPRTLATSGSLRLRREFTAHPSVAPPPFDTPLRNVSPQHSPQSAPPTAPIQSQSNETTTRSDAFYEDVLVGLPSAPPQVEGQPPEATSTPLRSYKPSTETSTEVNQDGSFESVACACSMQALPTLHDDADDYRSECENCKSATGSRYYLDNEDELVISPHETMTLHRRPEETASSTTPQYYRTSLTLPTSTRQRTRSTGARDNWFSSMPESSTESSDED